MILLTTCLSACATPAKVSDQADDFDYAMENLKPQFLDCWGKNESAENVFSFRKLTLTGYLYESGTYKYVDVDTIPDATKATKGCIQNLVMGHAFPARKKSVVLTYKMGFSI